VLREIITPYFIWGVILFEVSVAAGLPNIAGQFAFCGFAANDEGAFHCTRSGTDTWGNEPGGFFYMVTQFSAYFYNQIYKSTNTVTPLSLSTKFFIKY
jgi:hypothetical protein